MIKRLLWGGGIGLAALVGGLFYADRAALQTLDEMGVHYERMERGLFARRFYGVEYKNIRVGRVIANLLEPTSITAMDVQVAINPETGAQQLGSEAPNPLPDDLSVTLTGVTLLWDGEPVFSGLSGALDEGRIILDGDNVHISSGADLFELDWDGTIPSPWVSGEGSLHLQRGGRLKINVEVPVVVVEHDSLHSRPVSLERARIELEGDRLARSLHGILEIDGVESILHIEREGSLFSGSIVFGPMPLQEALKPLHQVLPEARNATISGSISGQTQFEWPQKTWDANFHLDAIDVDGAVPNDLRSLKRGLIQHRVLDEDGDPVLRSTGEGSLSWIPLRQIAPPMRHAEIASEDIRFTEHSGYDLESIHAALEANRAAGSITRGGSTLSQQLAKNLYLDGQRTVIRKIRELLLAVELDRSLGKGRILELYLNMVEWGPGIYGIRQASERYFMRRASQLNPNEAAFLAAILPSPRRFYRQQYLRNRAKETRIDWILENMGNAGRLSAGEVERWSQAPLRFVPPPKYEIPLVEEQD